MSTGITLSAAVRNNLLSLQNTASMMSETQNRLATGNKVNSAVDNATSYFTAQGLNNRASDLSALQDNMSLAVKTINAASTGIDGITKLVTQAQAIVNQAGQATGTATASTFVGDKTGLSANTAISASKITIAIGGNTAFSSTVTTLGGFVSAFNADTTNNHGAVASIDNGSLKVTASDGSSITVADATSTTLVAATPSTDTKNGTTAADDKAAKLKDFATQYNNLRAQINQISSDSSYNGVNLLNGQSLTVSFNAKGTSNLALTGVNMTTDGSDSKIGISSISTTDTSALTDGTASTELSKATSALRAQSSTFGSNLAVINARQDFTKSTIDNLQAGAGDLTLADTNQEGANLLALQTRQSLATTALSLSNRAESSILSILR